MLSGFITRLADNKSHCKNHTLGAPTSTLGLAVKILILDWLDYSRFGCGKNYIQVITLLRTTSLHGGCMLYIAGLASIRSLTTSSKPPIHGCSNVRPNALDGMPPSFWNKQSVAWIYYCLKASCCCRTSPNSFIKSLALRALHHFFPS
jgi:hypothetical protein